MTEAEAKTKWCPFGRRLTTLEDAIHGTPTDLGSQNRNSNDMPTTACIASACMAWRVASIRADQSAANGVLIDGFCGLAGQPAVHF